MKLDLKTIQTLKESDRFSHLNGSKKCKEEIEENVDALKNGEKSAFLAAAFIFIAENLAKGAISAAGAAIFEQQLHDHGILRKPTAIFRDNLEDAITRLANYFNERLDQQKLEDVQARLNSIHTYMEHYNLSPSTSEDRLSTSTILIEQCINDLKFLGVSAYDSVPVAYGMYLNILIERQKKFNEDKKIAIRMIQGAVDYVLLELNEYMRSEIYLKVDRSTKVQSIPRGFPPKFKFNIIYENTIILEDVKFDEAKKLREKIVLEKYFELEREITDPVWLITTIWDRYINENS